MRSRMLFVALLTLIAAAQNASAQTTLRGRTLSAETGEPVPGALVHDRISGTSAISDAHGEWRLVAVTGDSASLHVEHVGYITLHRPVATDARVVTLALTPNVTEMDALVVTASRRVQKLKDTPVTTELITRSEIAQTGGSDAAAVLLERTGIQLEGGHPAGGGAMLQGFGAERVLVLLDGQPLVGRMSGNFDLTRIPAGMLERIEVVKGPQSTLFGSDALGGVINLITRDPREGFGGSAEILSGTQDRVDFSGRVHGNFGRLSLLADGGRRQIGVTPGQARDAGALNQQWDALIKGQFAVSPTTNLHATALVVDESQRWQTGQLYNFAENLQLAGRATATLQIGRHLLTPTVAASQFRHTPARSSTDEITVRGTTETQQLREAELLHSFRSGRVVLDNGLELRDELLTSPNIRGGERSLSGLDAYTQATWSLGGLDIVPGVRFSTSEAWGTHWTPRIAMLYHASESLALRGSFGSAYRAPAFKELFMSFLNLGATAGYMVRGNEALRPESSINISAGAELIRPRYYARVQLFHNRFDNFIETQAVGDSAGVVVYSYGNIANGTTRGAELEISTAWKGARFEAGYSFLDTHDDATGDPLVGAPRHSGRLSSSYAFGFGTRISGTAIYTGTTPLQRTETEHLVREAYTRVDVRAAHALPHDIELSLGVNNLMDGQPALWPGYTGRQLYLGAAWRSN